MILGTVKKDLTVFTLTILKIQICTSVQVPMAVPVIFFFFKLVTALKKIIIVHQRLQSKIYYNIFFFYLITPLNIVEFSQH